MKIVNKSMEKVSIRDVKVGDTFLDDDGLWMRIRYEGDDIACPRCDEDIAISDHIDYMAVNLETGEVYNLGGYETVTLVECEAIIK